jgi:beta-lactam-binding protein with PASTA domain
VGRTVESMRWPGRTEWVEVPNLVGLDVASANDALSVRGLTLSVSSPKADPAPEAVTDKIVINQYPEAGGSVPPGAAVTVWIDDYPDDEGVREPRWPNPPLRELQMEREEPLAGTE